jgi:hypothetical protein
MVSGIEVAGLALAMLPLVIEVAKAYNRGVGSIKNVVLTERRDESLQDFYESFYWESFFLGKSLQKIVYGLPLLCLDCKSSLYSDRSLRAWEDNDEVRQALLLFFGDDDTLNAFVVVLSKTLDLVDRLTRDRTSKLPADQVSTQTDTTMPRYASKDIL